jgi:hypothetical protein
MGSTAAQVPAAETAEYVPTLYDVAERVAGSAV